MAESAEEVEVVTEERAPLPVRFFRGLVFIIKDAFGRMSTSEFWVGFISNLAKDMALAFINALGGRLISYGKEVATRDPDSPITVKSDICNGNGNSSSGSTFRGASTAFSNGYTPTSQYRGSDYGGGFPPVSYSNNQETTFPGFGK